MGSFSFDEDFTTTTFVLLPAQRTLPCSSCFSLNMSTWSIYSHACTGWEQGSCCRLHPVSSISFPADTWRSSSLQGSAKKDRTRDRQGERERTRTERHVSPEIQDQRNTCLQPQHHFNTIQPYLLLKNLSLSLQSPQGARFNPISDHRLKAIIAYPAQTQLAD